MARRSMKNPKYARNFIFFHFCLWEDTFIRQLSFYGMKYPICIPTLLESRIQMGLWCIAEGV